MRFLRIVAGLVAAWVVTALCYIAFVVTIFRFAFTGDVGIVAEDIAVIYVAVQVAVVFYSFLPSVAAVAVGEYFSLTRLRYHIAAGYITWAFAWTWLATVLTDNKDSKEVLLPVDVSKTAVSLVYFIVLGLVVAPLAAHVYWRAAGRKAGAGAAIGCGREGTAPQSST